MPTFEERSNVLFGFRSGAASLVLDGLVNGGGVAAAVVLVGWVVLGVTGCELQLLVSASGFASSCFGCSGFKRVSRSLADFALGATFSSGVFSLEAPVDGAVHIQL
jgi:hypothetical protein